jgi:hypothetical protein
VYDVREPGDLADAEWPYAFGRFAAQHDTLKAALMKMAYAGRRLYDVVFNQSVKKRLEQSPCFIQRGSYFNG